MFRLEHGRPVPNIPKPAHKEEPVREELTHPENAPDPKHWQDTRLHQVKPNHPITAPVYNELYDSLRTTRAWRYMADAFANGTITPTAGSTVTAKITATVPGGILRLSQWPDGVQAYFVVHSFGIAPQAAPVTGGALEVLLIDPGGYTIPIGDFWSATGGNSGQDIILPNPITDPGKLDLGLLSIQLQPGGASAVTYNWSMGLGIVYLLPNIKGYKPEFREPVHEGHDAIHTHIHH